METAYNSTHPYLFYFVFHEKLESYGYYIQSSRYLPYANMNWLISSFILRYLKNVRFQLVYKRQIIAELTRILGRKKMQNERDQYVVADWGIRHCGIKMAGLFFQIWPSTPRLFHVSPMITKNAFVIVSTVRSDARRESSETLSFQGLSTLVWVLVGFSLLVVTGLVTYFSFENEKNSRAKLISWMKSAFVYAADILNNCVAEVVRSGPGRQVRTWWLLGVVFLMQFWSAGMKSDLVLDHTSFVDSLEDLLARPELECLVSKNFVERDPFGFKEDDPRFEDYRKMRRFVDDDEGEESMVILNSGKGVIVGQESSLMGYASMKVANRRMYFGKKRYNERFSYMQFNKKLPRVIKEDIDYILSRLTETGQTEPRLRFEKFHSRELLIDAKENSATMSWSPKSFKFMSPVFRLWLIGVSLATVAFSVEFYLLRRRPVRVSPHHSIGIWVRA